MRDYILATASAMHIFNLLSGRLVGSRHAPQLKSDVILASESET